MVDGWLVAIDGDFVLLLCVSSAVYSGGTPGTRYVALLSLDHLLYNARLHERANPS